MDQFPSSDFLCNQTKSCVDKREKSAGASSWELKEQLFPWSCLLQQVYSVQWISSLLVGKAWWQDVAPFLALKASAYLWKAAQASAWVNSGHAWGGTLFSLKGLKLPSSCYGKFCNNLFSKGCFFSPLDFFLPNTFMLFVSVTQCKSARQLPYGKLTWPRVKQLPPKPSSQASNMHNPQDILV